MNLKPLSDKQRQSIRNATARVNIWHGSVRSGKTIASLVKWADVIAKHDGNGDLAMVGKTERTLKRNVIGPLADLLGPTAVNLKVGSGECVVMGELVYLIGANDERAEQKIRGATFAKLYGDELSLWPESFFKMALSRMSVDGAQLFGTTNPDSPLHYLKRDFLDREAAMNADAAAKRQRARLRSFHFELRDNPDLTDEYVDALAAEYTGLWRKRYIEGLWVLAEGAIWDSFDPDVHCVDELPDDLEFRRYVLGVDVGMVNPFVALLIGVDLDGGYWVLDEWRWDSVAKARQLSAGEYGDGLQSWIAGYEITPSAVYIDPSGEWMSEQLRHDTSWRVIDAENAVNDGLAFVANLFSRKRLTILRPNCAGLLKEIPAYSWEPRAQERGEDKPIKKADHGPDALRYGTYSDALYDPGDTEQYGWLS